MAGFGHKKRGAETQVGAGRRGWGGGTQGRRAGGCGDRI